MPRIGAEVSVFWARVSKEGGFCGVPGAPGCLEARWCCKAMQPRVSRVLPALAYLPCPVTLLHQDSLVPSWGSRHDRSKGDTLLPHASQLPEPQDCATLGCSWLRLQGWSTRPEEPGMGIESASSRYRLSFLIHVGLVLINAVVYALGHKHLDSHIVMWTPSLFWSLVPCRLFQC